MIELGAHAEFIVSAYIGVFLGIAALIGWTILASRQTQRRLRELGEVTQTGKPAK